MKADAHVERMTFHSIACCVCGVPFGLTASHEDHLRETHALFCCPNGHHQQFLGRTEAEAWRARAEAAERRAANLRDDLNVERASHAATKGQLTKVRNRVQAGVCPECRRHFTNLERHMHAKHGAAGRQ